MNYFKFIALFGLFSSFQASAGVLEARIAHLVPGVSKNEDTLVLLSNGEVLRSNDQKLIKTLESTSNQVLTFVESEQQIIAAVPSTNSLRANILERYFDPSLPSFSMNTSPSETRYTDSNFVPTNFKNIADVQKLMDELKYNEKSKSECFQRAHLWSIEMLQMAQIQSQKVFLFFTQKYIREYRFHWWFHVAPFVLVNDQERVVDPSFFDHPADMQNWINFFMVAHPTCKTVNKYQDYDQHQEDAYCYLRKLPMYYFEPTEVENRDVSNTVITEWIEDQVGSAYASLNNAPWWKR